jgi:anti-sigma factor RsiW
MNCSACSSRLGQRQDGELSARDAALIDAHLVTCARCRSLAGRMAAVESSLIRLAPIEAREDFTLAVMAKIAAMPAHEMRPARFWWLLLADIVLWAAVGALTALGAIRWKLVAAGAGSFAAKLGVALSTIYDVARDFHITTYLALGVGVEIAFIALFAAAGRKYLSRVRATLVGVLS